MQQGAGAHSSFRSRLRRQLAWFSLFLLLAIALDFTWLNLLTGLVDHKGGDQLMRWHARHRVPPSDIVFIDIDQASLDHPQILELAGKWLWPRVIHGELLSYLAAQRPRAIVFDITFGEPDVFRLDSDKAFADAIAASPAPVYLPIFIPDDGVGSRLADLPPIMGIEHDADADPAARLPIVAPKALPPALWRTGDITFLEDPDQIGRRTRLFKSVGGWRIPGMAARVAHDTAGLPLSQESVILNWYGKPFARYSYHTLFLKALSSHGGPAPDLAGKVIIIGSTAQGLFDLRTTPLDKRTTGMEVLGAALANLQQKDWLEPAPGWGAPALASLFVLISALCFWYGLHPVLIVAGGIMFSLAATGAAWLLLARNLQWLPFSALAFGWMAIFGDELLSYLQEKRKREEMQTMFSRFLDPRVVKTLADEGVIANAEAGHSREVTVLFSDIRDFTTLSESRPPVEIVSLLNRYFEGQVDVIFHCGGTLDKFIGDAIMAFWNAPVAASDHAVQAVTAALQMSEKVEAFSAGLDHPFEIGIGVHTGPAVVAFIGTSRRLDYTAIGDAVNLASRIEGKTKGLCRVLVSESTRLACGDAFDFIDRGEFEGKGRQQVVRLFEPRKTTAAP